jgi:hypothetical protein
MQGNGSELVLTTLREGIGGDWTGVEATGPEWKRMERPGLDRIGTAWARAHHSSGTDWTGRERTGREGTELERTGEHGNGWERTGSGFVPTMQKDGIGLDGSGVERTGRDGTGRERTGRERIGAERRGVERIAKDWYLQGGADESTRIVSERG